MMRLHLTTTPSNKRCCVVDYALSVNKISPFPLHSECHNSMHLPESSVINVFSVTVRIHHGLQHCIQHGLVDWVGGPAGPAGIKMAQIQCWAACTELQWAPWSLEHFVSACIQPIICNRSIAKSKTHENRAAHARPCLVLTLKLSSTEEQEKEIGNVSFSVRSH